MIWLWFGIVAIFVLVVIGMLIRSEKRDVARFNARNPPDRWKIILDITYQNNHKKDLERYMCRWSLEDHEPDNKDLFYTTLTSGVEFDYNIAQVQARAITTAKVAALEQTRKEAEAIHKEVTFP